MNNWSVYLLIVLALPFASMSNADDDEKEEDYYSDVVGEFFFNI